MQAGGYNTTSATPTAISQFNGNSQWTSAGFDAAGDDVRTGNNDGIVQL